MRAAAHDPEFAEKVGIPQDVARDFEKEDKKKSVFEGGLTPLGKQMKDSLEKKGVGAAARTWARGIRDEVVHSFHPAEKREMDGFQNDIERRVARVKGRKSRQ